MQQSRKSFRTTAGKIVFYVLWVPLLVGGILVGRQYAMGFLGRLGLQILAILLAWIVAGAVDRVVDRSSSAGESEQQGPD